MGVEMQRRVKIQELDMRIKPLHEEKEKIELHIQMISENLKMLSSAQVQSENEGMMMEEDLVGSEKRWKTILKI
jgi:hypothetical protein